MNFIGNHLVLNPIPSIRVLLTTTLGLRCAKDYRVLTSSSLSLGVYTCFLASSAAFGCFRGPNEKVVKG